MPHHGNEKPQCRILYPATPHGWNQINSVPLQCFCWHFCGGYCLYWWPSRGGAVIEIAPQHGNGAMLCRISYEWNPVHQTNINSTPSTVSADNPVKGIAIIDNPLGVFKSVQTLQHGMALTSFRRISGSSEPCIASQIDIVLIPLQN